MNMQKHYRLVEFRRWAGQNGINPAGTAEDRASPDLEAASNICWRLLW